MEVILRGRGDGKTTKLVKISADKRYTIVCIEQHNIALTLEIAERLGLDIPKPITFQEFLDKRYKGRGNRIRGFLIDNADILLQSLSSDCPIYAVTMTKDDYNRF